MTDLKSLVLESFTAPTDLVKALENVILPACGQYLKSKIDFDSNYNDLN